MLGMAYGALDRRDDALKEHKILKGLDDGLAKKLRRAIDRDKKEE